MAAWFSSPLSRVLLTAAVAGSAVISGGGSARAGCVGSGATLNCTGDLSGGVALNNGSGPITTLNVLGLTTDITPGSGIEGVLFGSQGSVALHVDLGPWRIITNGIDTEGVIAESIGSGAVDVAIAGAVQTTGDLSAGIEGSTVTGPLSIAAFTSILTTGLNSAGIRGGSFTGSVDIYMAGDITTMQAGSFGIEAASQGPVNITAFGSISTYGDAASGIRAQSNNGALTIEVAGTITTSGENADGIFASGATVSILSDAAITTYGLSGVGIAASGQNGALVASTGNISTDLDNAPGIELETFNGTASVTSTGGITTRGMNSAAIEVRSQTGSAFVDVSGDIRTQGTDSPGIDVEAAGTVLVRSSGNIFATGLGSPGITAAGQDVVVTNSGRIEGGPCCGGVMMDADDSATLRNYGTIIGQPSGEAIYGIGNDILVENVATVTGNVFLFGNNSAVFNNHAGALFNSGETVIAQTVLNEGTIAPGGRGMIETTHLNLGTSLVQTQTGIFAVDIDGAVSSADEIEASGDATLAGKVAVSLISLPLTAAQSFTILTTDIGTVADEGLGLIASPALHATLSTDSNNVYLGIAVDFDVDGLNPNQRAIAIDLGRIFVAGAGGVTPVLLGLLNVTDLQGYRSALDQLSPEIYSDAEIAALYSNLAFTGSLMSCKVNGTDAASIIREGQCLWAGASARFLDTGSTSQQIGFDETAGLFTAGAQAALDDVWRIGFAGGYQSSTLETATGASSDGSLGQAGIALKYNPGRAADRGSRHGRWGSLRHAAADVLRRLFRSRRGRPGSRHLLRQPARGLRLRGAAPLCQADARYEPDAAAARRPHGVGWQRRRARSRRRRPHRFLGFAPRRGRHGVLARQRNARASSDPWRRRLVRQCRLRADGRVCGGARGRLAFHRSHQDRRGDGAHRGGHRCHQRHRRGDALFL